MTLQIAVYVYGPTELHGKRGSGSRFWWPCTLRGTCDHGINLREWCPTGQVCPGAGMEGEHRAPELQKEAVYGLTELHREEVRKARLVANPGCYPTSVQLPLCPLLEVSCPRAISHQGN